MWKPIASSALAYEIRDGRRMFIAGLPRWLSGKEPPAITGDLGLILGFRRFPGGVRGNPLQYFCLESFMDRGAWWATVHGVAELGTTQATEQACMFVSKKTPNHPHAWRCFLRVLFWNETEPAHFSPRPLPHQ